MKINSYYFYGHEVSSYAKQQGYVDYATLAKAFDAVLNNDIMSVTHDIGCWEQVSGFIDNSDEQGEPVDVYQWYIVSNNGASILEEINEIVFYNEELDMYLWGVTHYGTGWDYVLTNIAIECEEV